MSAETLRRAATQMRNEWFGTTQEDFYAAVAEWLDGSTLTLCHRHDNAGDCSTVPSGCIVHAPALAVARAYLDDAA